MVLQMNISRIITTNDTNVDTSKNNDVVVVSIALGLEWYTNFEQLCAVLRLICPKIVSDSHPSTKALVCQCIGRASKIIRLISINCIESTAIEMPSEVEIHYLAAAVNSIATGISPVKRILESVGGAIILIYNACDALLAVIDKTSSRKTTAAHTIEKSQFLSNISGRRKSSVSPASISMSVTSAALKKSIALIKCAYAMAAPSPQDIFSELARIWQAKVARRQNQSAIQFSSDNPTSFSTSALDSIRLQFILFGLQKVVKSSAFNCKTAA